MKNKASVSRSVASGVAWMLSMRMGLRILGLISTVILARLLTPEDFGIVAIAMSIFALLHLVKDFGFDTVIIQMQNPEKKHYDTAWTFNLIFGLALCAILIFLSNFIADLYETPELENLVLAVACLFIIGGLESVGTLDFRKNLTFEKEFRLKIVPKLIGVPCTLLLAYWLQNYWSLTIGTIITQVAMLVMGYMMHSYRPSFSFSAAKELFNFSKWLMANNLIYYINNRSPELLIGKILNPASAGLFAVSNEVAFMITTEVSAAVSRASYPGYAKIANDPKELRALYLNVISSVAILLFPMGLGVATIAHLIIPVLLGDQWLETIPVIRILAIAGLFMALNSNTGYLFMALGNPRLSTVLGSIRVLIFIPSLIIFINYQGLIGAAWAFLLTASLMFVISNLVIVSRLPISILDLLKAFYRPCLAAFFMAAVVTLIYDTGSAGFHVSAWSLLLSVVLGAATYFLLLFFFWWLANKPIGLESKIYHAFVNGMFCSK